MHKNSWLVLETPSPKEQQPSSRPYPQEGGVSGETKARFD